MVPHCRDRPITAMKHAMILANSSPKKQCEKIEKLRATKANYGTWRLIPHLLSMVLP
jgi:hypothetical protein